MHELSIATALADQVRRHTPAGQVAVRVRIEAGPLQGIDVDALQVAWRSVTADSPLAAAELLVTVFPWQLWCDRCNRRWASADMFDPCECGNQVTIPEGSDELRLVSLDVEPAPTVAVR